MYLSSSPCAIILSTFLLPALVNSQLQEVDPPQFHAPKTFQTLLQERSEAQSRAARRIQNSDFYLPGLGVVKSYVPSQIRPQRQSQTPGPLSVLPVSVSVSARSPASGQAPGDNKCEYVQMKGEPTRLEENCMRGGMSCERKCDYDTSDEVCTETLTDVCEDSKEEVCQTVMEKSCRTVQEEECRDPEESNTKTECSVVMEEKCEEVEEQDCRMETEMECETVEKEACTTLREPVCSPTSKTVSLISNPARD